MDFNLVEVTRAHFDPEAIQRLADGLGEDRGAVERGLDAAIPEVAGGIVQRGESEEGARKLCSALMVGAFDGALLERMRGMLDGGSGTRQLAERGKGLLVNLFGSEQQALGEQLASFSGLKQDAAAQLLQLTAAMAMGTLGRHREQQDLDAKGLQQLLGTQSDPAGTVTPVQVGHHAKPGEAAKSSDGRGAESSGSTLNPHEKAGIERQRQGLDEKRDVLAEKRYELAKERDELAQKREELTHDHAKTAREKGGAPASEVSGSSAPTPGVTPPEVPPTPAPHRRIQPVRTRDKAINPTRWVLPAVLAVVLIVGWSMLRNGRDARDADEIVSETSGQRQGRGTEGPREPGAPPRGAPMGSIELPNGGVLRAPEDSGLFLFATALAQGQKGSATGGSGEAADAQRFAFIELSFEGDDSALTEDGRSVVGQIAKVMAAYPDAKIRVEGHTAGTGAPTNRELSQKRADAVKASLVEQGVKATRIEARGHGDSDPMATSDTAAGRRANSRTDIILVR